METRAGITLRSGETLVIMDDGEDTVLAVDLVTIRLGADSHGRTTVKWMKIPGQPPEYVNRT